MDDKARCFLARSRRAAPWAGALGAVLVVALATPSFRAPEPAAAFAGSPTAPGKPSLATAYHPFHSQSLPLRAGTSSTVPITSHFRTVIEPTESTILEVLLRDSSRSLDDRIQTATRELGRYPTPAEIMRHLPEDEPDEVEIAATGSEDLLTAAWNAALGQFERESAREVLEERLFSPAPESIRNIRVSLDLVLLDPRPAVFIAFDCAPRDIHAIIAQRGFRPASRAEIPAPGEAPPWWDDARLRADCELYTLESDGVLEVLFVSPDWQSAHHLSLG